MRSVMETYRWSTETRHRYNCGNNGASCDHHPFATETNLQQQDRDKSEYSHRKPTPTTTKKHPNNAASQNPTHPSHHLQAPSKVTCAKPLKPRQNNETRTGLSIHTKKQHQPP